MPRRQQPRRDNGPPKPEKVETAFSPETLKQLAEERMRDIKHIVVYRRRVPSRETVEAYPQTVHVSLDAGGVVGRMLVDNAISPNEHEALLGCPRPASSFDGVVGRHARFPRRARAGLRQELRPRVRVLGHVETLGLDGTRQLAPDRGCSREIR